jgi:hypothetical protein
MLKLCPWRPVFVITKVYGTPTWNVVSDDSIVLSARVMVTVVALAAAVAGASVAAGMASVAVAGAGAWVAAGAGLPQAVATNAVATSTNNKVDLLMVDSPCIAGRGWIGCFYPAHIVLISHSACGERYLSMYSMTNITN